MQWKPHFKQKLTYGLMPYTLASKRNATPFESSETRQFFFSDDSNDAAFTLIVSISRSKPMTYAVGTKSALRPTVNISALESGERYSWQNFKRKMDMSCTESKTPIKEN